MQEESFRIIVDGGQSVTAIRARATRPASWTLLYAPGAGSNINDPFGRALAKSLTGQDVEVVRFQFPYAEAKRRFPDKPPLLMATWRAAIEQAGGSGRICISGRSMGGRVASMVAAEGAEVDALVLFAYPLHPPGQPETLRVEHLPMVRAPTLFVSGTADQFGSPEELGRAVALVPGARLHLLEAADHGFGALGRGGRTRASIFQEAIETARGFLTSQAA